MAVAAPPAEDQESERDGVADIALVGNPNAGKSSVFNGLTGLRQKVGNYPGVTVEKRFGTVVGPAGGHVRLHDLPGLYSLVPHSTDESISAKALHSQEAGAPDFSLVLIVVDASNLSRGLYLVTQVLDLGRPAVLVLNMIDTATQNGLHIDAEALQKELGIPVIPTVARKGEGIEAVRAKIFSPPPRPTPVPLTLASEAEIALAPVIQIMESQGQTAALSRAEGLRLVANPQSMDLSDLESGSKPQNANTNAQEIAGAQKGKNTLGAAVVLARSALEAKGIDAKTLEAKARYGWIDAVCARVVRQGKAAEFGLSERLDRVLTHRLIGPVLALAVFAAIFQSIFSWAEYPMELIDGGVAAFGQWVADWMPDGVLESLVVDGIIAGVGAVVIFLPQILFLFFFLNLLEDTGYLARIAFMGDRFLRGVGLSGHSAIPLLSSFACAIPGIMATRTIGDWRARLTTIMVAPLMSCNARLPVYTLVIAAFIPDRYFLGIFSLAGLTLLSMYLLGVVAAVGVALAFKRFMPADGPESGFMMELPPYRRPSLRWTGMQMLERARIFIADAGKVILAISVVLWFLASYPKVDDASAEGEKAGDHIRQSYAGQVGRFIEPAIEPLGFDWKIGIGLITSFAAREVLVTTLATIYNLEDADETSVNLRQRLRDETDPDTGKPAYTALTGVSLMVFFVLACQCMATVAVVKRETNSWRWPVLMVLYMNVLAYVGSFVVFQGGKILGYG
jgi:ferrous iron transport protein B